MSTTKTFEQLLEEATMEKDEKLDKLVEEKILPKVHNFMSHRMYILTKHHTFNGAKELFAKAMEQTTKWFEHTTMASDGYRLTCSEPDRHGRVTLTFSLALFDIARTYNLSSMVTKSAIFNSTFDNLFQ